MSLKGISDQTIKQKAEEQGVNHTDIEKDYVNGWLLHGIYTQSDLADNLVLKGGNALRKGYYADYRFSKDLDFSLLGKVEHEQFRKKFNEVLSYVADRTGIQFDFDKTNVRPKNLPHINFNVFEADAYYHGFHNEEKITLKAQLDLTEFDKIFLPVQEKQLIHNFNDADQCLATIKCHKAEEIIASKLNTLIHRRKAVDLFDLIFSMLIKNPYDLKRVEVIKTFIKKYAFEQKTDFVKQQLLNTPLNEHKKLWDTFRVPESLKIGFDIVEQGYVSLISSLFALIAPSGPLPSLLLKNNGYPSYNDYFDAEFRQKIITAGQSKTLIEMTYDGYTRMVEPYAFEYRRRKDGRAYEYFWGYDQTGGSSGKQSIKMFFAHKIQSVFNTSQPYNPQWVVEF